MKPDQDKYPYEVRAIGGGLMDHHVKWCKTIDQAESVIYMKEARVVNDRYDFYIVENE